MSAFDEWADALSADDRVPGILRRAAIALIVIGVAGFLLVGANGPADPAPVAGPPARHPVPGFTEVAFRIVPPGGAETALRCALLADRPESRARGLRGQRNLRGYDAMLFAFDADITGPFVMGGVELPLDIAWFDALGRVVSTAEMAPCPGEADNACPHQAAGPYRYALETERGGLSRLGVQPGVALVRGGACS